MTNKTKVIIVVAIAAVSYAFGRYMTPSKIEYKTIEVVKEQEHVNKDIVVTEKEVRNKDGSVTIDRRIEDKSVETRNKESSRMESKVVTNQKTQWKAHALVGVQKTDFANPIYGLQIERRIVGPIFVGAWGMDSKEYGVSVGLEF